MLLSAGWLAASPSHASARGEWSDERADHDRKGKARVTSKLYETRGATVVYTVNTKVRNVQTTDEASAAVTGPIGKRLRRDGLTR